jgi:hypothetical protein
VVRFILPSKCHDHLAGVRIFDSLIDLIEFLIELVKFFPDEQLRLISSPVAAPAVCLTNLQLEEYVVPVVEHLNQQIEAGNAASIESWQYEGLFSQYIRDLHEYVNVSMRKGYKDFMVIFFK